MADFDLEYMVTLTAYYDGATARRSNTVRRTATLKPSQQTCRGKAEYTYPSEVAFAVYVSGDATATSRQVAFTSEHFPVATHEVFLEAARRVVG